MLSPHRTWADAPGPADWSRLRALAWDAPALAGRPARATYAIVDGAAADDELHLPSVLHALALPHACLHAGPLAPDMAAVAPYLVRLPPQAPATRTLLERMWSRAWGVLLQSDGGGDVLRRHLRQFLRVRDETGRPLYFRFYDPRVIVPYLASCTADERRAFFGPVAAFLAQEYPVRNRPGDAMVRLTLGADGALRQETVVLASTAIAAAPPG